MSKLKTFFYSLRRSLMDSSYFTDVLKSPFKFSLKFFFFFCLLYGLISAISINAYVIPEVNTFVSKAQDKIYDLYPQELEITFNDNKVSINQEVPYFIPFDLKEWIGQDIPDTSITNLLVIDTDSTNPSKDINQYQTLTLLTKDSLAIKGERNEVRVFPLDQTGTTDATINYDFYKQILNKITPYFKYLSLITAGAVVFFFLVFFPLSKLLHLTIFSLIAMLVSKLAKPKLAYKQTFQIGLHAFVLPTLIVELIRFFTTTLPVPFFYSMVFLVWFLLILSKLEKKKLSRS